MPTVERQLHGPHTRYVKLRVTHAPGMPGAFSRVIDPDMREAHAMMHAGIVN